MNFEQFLTEGPLTSLLGLMAIPLLAAAVLVGFLVFSFTRRRKKSKMKHGIQPASSPTEEELDANVNPPDDDPPTEATREDTPPDITGSLNLGILSKRVEGETTMETPQEPSTEENIDLSARLNMQTSAEETAPEPVTPLPPQKPVELLRLLRDPQSGQLIVQVGGEQYTKLADIKDKKIGQFVLKVAAHFLAFTNGVIVTDAGMKNLGMPNVGAVPEPVAKSGQATQPQPTPVPEPESDSDSDEEPLIPRPSPEAEAAFLASLRASTISREPQSMKPQKTGTFLSFGKPSTSSVGQSSGGLGLNLAEEINEIVQNRLRYSPLAENYRIDIQSEPGGGIRIVVNNQIYSSADDVPNTEVRDLIKASIKEWESL